MSARRNEIQCKVKEIFISEVSSYLDKNPAREIQGAIAFLDFLETLNDVTISFATGGWCETEMLKLDSAGFNYSKEYIASSNDHYKRTQIMKLAKEKYPSHENFACTYFGDGIWDKEACEELGFNFVLKTKHTQNISDFNPASKAMAHIDV